MTTFLEYEGKVNKHQPEAESSTHKKSGQVRPQGRDGVDPRSMQGIHILTPVQRY